MIRRDRAGSGGGQSRAVGRIEPVEPALEGARARAVARGQHVATGGGDADERGPPVGRVGDPLGVAGGLEPVDQAWSCPAG